jgi:hypothetical protein
MRLALAAAMLLGACTAPEPAPPAATVRSPADSVSPDGWYEPVRVDAGTGATRGEYLRAAQSRSLPEWAHARAQREGHTRTLALAHHLNPFYQGGDFDGDGALDVAVLVSRRATGEIGILLLPGGDTPSTLLGAGAPFGNGGADFEWMTNWSVRPKGASATPGDALEVVKLESASALVFWDGRAWQWRQLGD